MSIPSPSGVAFLDLLASALIALLIIYLTAPEAESPSADAHQVSFSLQGSPDPRASIVVCVKVRNELACSTGPINKDIFFQHTESGVVVASWPATIAATSPKAWVSLYDISRYPPGDLQVAITTLGAGRTVHQLSKRNGFSIADVQL